MSCVPRRLRALRSAAILTEAVTRIVSELDPGTQEALICQTLEATEELLMRYRWNFTMPHQPSSSSPSSSNTDLPF
jgi:hypothetical protein